MNFERRPPWGPAVKALTLAMILGTSLGCGDAEVAPLEPICIGGPLKEEACLAQGGLPMDSGTSCFCRAKDAGKPCRLSTECEGRCVVKNLASEYDCPAQTSGVCSDYVWDTLLQCVFLDRPEEPAAMHRGILPVCIDPLPYAPCTP